MIERLLLALRFFAEDAAPAPADGEATRRAAGDFLDAYRLIVDCPQYELGATARAALADVEGLTERLDGDATDPEGRRRILGDTRAAARRALIALGAPPS